jgi:hypothetical protein
MTSGTNKSPYSPSGQGSLGVLRAGGQYRLITCEPVQAGAWLFSISGEPTDTPSRYSIQIGADLHLDLPPQCPDEFVIDTYFWRFMNHSCEPNVQIHHQEVFAIADIAAGEEITFHYNTTEYSLAESFECLCGAARCAGLIAGFSAMGAAERQRLWPWVARHLRASAPTPDGHLDLPAPGLPKL